MLNIHYIFYLIAICIIINLNYIIVIRLMCMLCFVCTEIKQRIKAFLYFYPYQFLILPTALKFLVTYLHLQCIPVMLCYLH